MSSDIETIVIGAGVIGLAAGRALAEAGQEVLVLEQAALVGSEISARNSEVIHAGLYYPPGSLKARFCVEGRKALYQFCRENGVIANRCGKLVVATQESEVPKLEALAENAKANGIRDPVLLSGAEARSLEPALACEAALLSPSTGVVDSHGFMQALEGHITSKAGQIVLNTRVTGATPRSGSGFELAIESDGAAGHITCDRLVNAAGLGASEIGAYLHLEGDYRPPQTYPAKGHYYQVTGPVPFRHLIYPLPEGAWLGLHLTFDCGGKAKLGPDLEWVESIDYAFDDSDGARLATFSREARRYWPSLPAGALAPDYTGIRPKIYRKEEPAADFAIHGPETHGLPNFVGLYGIESPGLTSSLAIGSYLAELLSVRSPSCS
ncbi:MAG: NAD(P)/FAD-dependent oxidoreductase [Rhodospirillales bacterium]|nr:NAD(P)/FAD-dependent oxidoreductase [Rhodospirillales bacterium]MDH3917615.1 NAD(P)/FAD-dependent oxidoreductase [Rhodospirillales bacterium]MDH3970137.1 NAD(P)/FAD-dependent oxidoreductase [Rhodospirillales bacterium]